MKTIMIPMEEEEYVYLLARKGKRTWKEFIMRGRGYWETKQLRTYKEDGN